MALRVEPPDLYWSNDGDLVLDDATGDLLDTKNFLYRARLQQITTRINSTRGDWRMQPDLGANVGEFLGQPNTRATGDALKQRLLSELSMDSLLGRNQFSLDVVPVSESRIAILISLHLNGSGKPVQLTYTYDLAQNLLVARNL